MLKSVRVVIVIMIFLVATIAWNILGFATAMRGDKSQKSLRNSVSSLCGSALNQHEPKFIIKNDIKKIIDKKSKKREVEKLKLPSASDIQVDFKLEHRKKGLIWFPIYDCKFTGKYTLENNTKSKQQIILNFKYPAEKATYNDFSIKVDDQLMPLGTEFSQSLKIPFELQAQSKKNITIYYQMRGTNEWLYTPNKLIKNLNMTVSTDFKDIDFLDGSTAPTTLKKSATGCTAQWKATNLISDYGMGIDMPNKLNPGEIVPRITFFAPVCLLFFFVVLATISILRKIDIHPMHYLFTAAGFFAFNLLFAYLVDLINIHIAFGISAVVTLLLVNLYLKGALKERFPSMFAFLAQLVYLILFSYSFFFKGITGLSVAVVSVITLAILMRLTIDVNWSTVFIRNSEK